MVVLPLTKVPSPGRAASAASCWLKAWLTRRVIRLLEFLWCAISPKTVVQIYQFFLGDTLPYETVHNLHDEIAHNLYLITFNPKVSFPQDILKILTFKIRQEVKSVRCLFFPSQAILKSFRHVWERYVPRNHMYPQLIILKKAEQIQGDFPLTAWTWHGHLQHQELWKHQSYL